MEATIKILIAEHDPVDLELMQHALAKSGLVYLSRVVQNEQDYINALTAFTPDIILSDYTFPSFDGPTAFKIREAVAPHTPFIFVSGTIGEERSIELIRNGVTDYCLKDQLLTLNHKVLRALSELGARRQKNEMEQALIQNEHRLTRAQQVAHMGNWELNFETNTLSWSDETFRIYGLVPNRDHQPLDYVLSFVHPEDAGPVTKAINSSRDSLEDFSITYRIIRKNGSIRHIYLDSKLELDPAGKPIGLFGIVHDVTRIVLLENKLTEARTIRQKLITGAVLAAQETERATIGNELNENLNQILAAAKMYVQLSKRQKDKRLLYVDMCSKHIQEVMVQIRKISKTLAIPQAHLTNLADNIKNLIHDLSLIHPLIVEFYKDNLEIDVLNEKLQVTIFRIVQEQLNNILVHSGATQAVVRISGLKNEITLSISDNGDGCDPQKINGGLGIMNVKARAELYDGKVDIISAPGKGYELKVELPLGNKKAREVKEMPATAL